jgi:hypothetical protein
VKNIDDRYDLAVSLLKADKGGSIFPVAVFKWNAAMALIADRQGPLEKAREFALGALEAASVRGTELTYHRELGMVDESFVPILERLKKMAAKSDLQ